MTYSINRAQLTPGIVVTIVGSLLFFASWFADKYYQDDYNTKKNDYKLINDVFMFYSNGRVQAKLAVDNYIIIREATNNLTYDIGYGTKCADWLKYDYGMTDVYLTLEAHMYGQSVEGKVAWDANQDKKKRIEMLHRNRDYEAIVMIYNNALDSATQESMRRGKVMGNYLRNLNAGISKSGLIANSTQLIGFLLAGLGFMLEKKIFVNNQSAQK